MCCLKGTEMCNNDSLIKHPIRKSRSKTRRPKFLSLRSELISPRFPPMIHRPPSPPPPQRQLTLFPLHPENLDREENVAFIFENDVVSSSCCSLQSFLPSYQNDMSSEEESRNLAEEAELVRTAMRSRERETGVEEKWVCYSEVVEKTTEEVEEVTSTAADEWLKKINHKKKKKIKKKVEMMGNKQLWLKLDYEGILNAWPDKAPLFINGESPAQTVPDLLHEDPNLCFDSLPHRNMMDGMGSEQGHNSNNNNNMWKVPEMGILKKEEEIIMEGNEGWKMGQREASVLRYKEKRQSRLFSKRIRYEVRKLNAEKRPRMKGRFVKRS